MEIVKFLLEFGVDVNEVNNDGASSLLVASQDGHFEIAKILLESGANVNGYGENKRTALSFVSYNGHFKVAKTLLEYGADVNIRDRSGKSPLKFAISRQNHNLIPLFHKYMNRFDEDGKALLQEQKYSYTLDTIRYL